MVYENDCVFKYAKKEERINISTDMEFREKWCSTNKILIDTAKTDVMYLRSGSECCSYPPTQDQDYQVQTSASVSVDVEHDKATHEDQFDSSIYAIRYVRSFTARFPAPCSAIQSFYFPMNHFHNHLVLNIAPRTHSREEPIFLVLFGGVSDTPIGYYTISY